MRTTFLALTSILAGAGGAHALNQSRHYQIANDSCLDAGMPSKFCDELATQTYNVDAYEFNDLSAHSQIPEGATACDAANAVLVREAGLGAQIRQLAGAIGYSPSRDGNGQFAQAIGRALHTVQDNCAHSGMPNPQHAWHSLNDVCNGTSESPDIVPEAIACARVETDAVISAVVGALHDLGGDFAQLADVDDEGKHFPPYKDVCDFLGGSARWDGSDRRWDNGVVAPAIRGQLLEAINNDYPQSHDVCADTTDGILVSYVDDVNVSGGTPSCLKIHAFCLGKADTLEGSEPPYEALEQVPAHSAAGGCSVVVGERPSLANGVLLGAALLGLVLVSRRRRDRDSL